MSTSEYPYLQSRHDTLKKTACSFMNHHHITDMHCINAGQYVVVVVASMGCYRGSFTFLIFRVHEYCFDIHIMYILN
jgi:hypothetical protein